jgi:hypothetical protein
MQTTLFPPARQVQRQLPHRRRSSRITTIHTKRFDQIQNRCVRRVSLSGELQWA